MMRIAFALGLSLFISSAYSQVLYALDCNQPCEKCVKVNAPVKFTYKADPKSQVVIQVVEFDSGEKNAHSHNCRVIDRQNWICPGTGVNQDFGKHYAVDGTAYWNNVSSQDSTLPPSIKEIIGRYSCRYRKTLLGHFEVISETKRW